MITTDTVTDCTTNDLSTTTTTDTSTQTTYDGSTSLAKAIAEVLKLCSISNTEKISRLTKEACTALGLPIDTTGRKKPAADALAIFEWLRDNKTTSATESIDLPIIEPVAPAEEVAEAIEPKTTTADLFAPLEPENVIVPIGTTAIPVLPDMTLAEAQAKHAELKSIHAIARTMLLEMRDRKGWLALGFESWADYAIKEWGYSENYLNRLANAARIQSVIVPIGTNEIPESHTRELANLPNDDAMREVYDRVSAENEKITAKAIQDAVNEWKAKHDAVQHELLTTRNNQAEIIEAKVSAAIATEQANLVVENSSAIQALEKQLSDAKDKIAQHKKDSDKAIKDGVARGLYAKELEVERLEYQKERLTKEIEKLREVERELDSDFGLIQHHKRNSKKAKDYLEFFTMEFWDVFDTGGDIPTECLNEWLEIQAALNKVKTQFDEWIDDNRIDVGAVLVGEVVN